MRTRSGDIYDLINRREQTVNQQDEELDFANDSANMGMLAQGLSNAVRGLGSFQGKMPENPTAPLFRMRGDQAYRDLTARRSEQDRGDKMLLENLDLSKFAEEEKRKDEALPPSSRLLLQQRIRQLPIDGTEQIELPEGMTIRQVENDPVLGQLLKELIPKSGNINEEIKRAELLSEQQRKNLPMSDIDRSILQKKLTGSGIDVKIPDTMTYGQANENPYLKQFTKTMNGFGNDLGMMRFGFEQQRFEIDQEARKLERQARENERKLEQQYRQNKDYLERTTEKRKEARPSEKSVEQLVQYDTALSLLEDIKKRKPKFNTGRFESAKNAGAQLIGVDDPEYSAFKADVNDQLAQYIKSISGAAASDKERGFLSQIQISTNDNDKTFMAKLESAINKIKNARAAHVEAQERIGKDMSQFQETVVPKSKFPMTLRKDGNMVEVTNEQELKEAKSEGWK